MSCKACDILPLAPKRVRLNHWRVSHQKNIGWAVSVIVLISVIVAIIFWYKKQQAEKEKQNGTGTETGAEKVLGEKSMDGSSSRIGNSVTH